jgi:glycosyltransferase involved in cell wall biosynthesis
LGITSEVFALSSSKVDRVVTVDNHKVYRCKSLFELASTPFSLSALTRFKQCAADVDIIHYHYPYPFADILYLFFGTKKPSLVTYHSDIIKQKHLLKLYKPLMNFFLGSVDKIVSTSPNYLRSSETLGKFIDKVSIIPLGLDKARYPKVNENLDALLWKKYGSKFFLFVGVLRYYKGLHILIEASKGSNYPIIIAGSGPIEHQLKTQASKTGINNIHFVGFVDEEMKASLLRTAYVILFPSHLRSEAFGISLLEGAMFGKALISSEIGTGTTYINIDKETGLVVSPNDPIALRQAMDYLWNNPKEVVIMGRNAEARYLKLFTTERMAESYVNIYNDLTKRCTPALLTVRSVLIAMAVLIATAAYFLN